MLDCRMNVSYPALPTGVIGRAFTCRHVVTEGNYVRRLVVKNPISLPLLTVILTICAWCQVPSTQVNRIAGLPASDQAIVPQREFPAHWATAFVSSGKSKTAKPGFRWGRALFESFTFLAIEQAYVVHDDYRWGVIEMVYRLITTGATTSNHCTHGWSQAGTTAIP